MDDIVQEKITAFFANYPQLQFKRKEIIIHATEPITHIYSVSSGYIQQRFISKDGDEITVHVFRSPAYFPMMGALSGMENDYDFVALQQLVVRKAPVDDVIQFIKENPDVMYDLLTRFARGITGMANKNVLLTFADARAKLAGILLYFAQSLGRKEGSTYVITMHLTHADIAAWIGISRETVSRQFEKFEEAGIVEYKRNHIIIKDMQSLQQNMHKSLRDE